MRKIAETPQDTPNSSAEVLVELTSMQRAEIGGRAIVLARVRKAQTEKSQKPVDRLHEVNLVAREEYLPLTIGRVASADLISGLRIMAEATVDESVDHAEFNPASARQWLAELEGPTIHAYEAAAATNIQIDDHREASDSESLEPSIV